jgi:hypothetical protein
MLRVGSSRLGHSSEKVHVPLTTWDSDVLRQEQVLLEGTERVEVLRHMKT